MLRIIGSLIPKKYHVDCDSNWSPPSEAWLFSRANLGQQPALGRLRPRLDTQGQLHNVSVRQSRRTYPVHIKSDVERPHRAANSRVPAAALGRWLQFAWATPVIRSLAAGTGQRASDLEAGVVLVSSVL